MRSANGSGCGSLASIMVRSVPRRPQAKEPGPIPRGAGDGAGDGREAPVRRLPPDEPFRHDGDGVALALILAHEDCAGLEAALAFGRGSTLQEAGQQLHRGAVEAAQGRFLDVPDNAAREQVLGESWGRSRPEGGPPQRAELVDALSLSETSYGWR